MGSLGGAAVGALLLRARRRLRRRLPAAAATPTNYSIIVTFALLARVLAVRPLGLFGRPA